jgi:hypothetical protein
MVLNIILAGEQDTRQQAVTGYTPKRLPVLPALFFCKVPGCSADFTTRAYFRVRVYVLSPEIGSKVNSPLTRALPFLHSAFITLVLNSISLESPGRAINLKVDGFHVRLRLKSWRRRERASIKEGLRAENRENLLSRTINITWISLGSANFMLNNVSSGRKSDIYLNTAQLLPSDLSELTGADGNFGRSMGKNKIK